MSTDASSIGEKLGRIERRLWLTRLFGLGLVVAIVAAAYFSIGFLTGTPVPEVFADLSDGLRREITRTVDGETVTEYRGFIPALSDFFPPNFVDLTVYSQSNEINGIDGLIRSFTHPSSFARSLAEPSSQVLVSGAVITIAVGFVGTVVGFPFALVFGVLGSERVTPFPLNFLFRGTMSTIRAVPALVWILIFVPLAGISTTSAVLAVATDTVGNMGRLFTDELEEIDEGPIEAIKSTGANRAQVISFGMLSQVYTSFVAWALYILEINVRIAISLGVVGAGGIGQYLSLKQQLLQFDKLAAGLVMVVFIVLSVELVSSRLRARLRPDEHESKGLVDAIRDLGDGGKWLGTGSQKG